MKGSIKLLTGNDLDSKTFKVHLQKTIPLYYAGALPVTLKTSNGKELGKYSFIAFSLKSSTCLSGDIVKVLSSLMNLSSHELLHSLFSNGAEILKQEFLADGLSSRISGKDAALSILKEAHDLGQSFDSQTDENHPSIKDRVNAIINDTYADPVDKILEVVRQRTKEGKKWAGMLSDKKPSDFISR